jgi:hypothetical protein
MTRRIYFFVRIKKWATWDPWTSPTCVKMAGAVERVGKPKSAFLRCAILATVVEALVVHYTERSLDNCDPEEMVSCPMVDGSLITLKSAVKGVMMLPVETRAAAVIFRDLEPTPLCLPDIEELAKRADFRT